MNYWTPLFCTVAPLFFVPVRTVALSPILLLRSNRFPSSKSSSSPVSSVLSQLLSMLLRTYHQHCPSAARACSAPLFGRTR